MVRKIKKNTAILLIVLFVAVLLMNQPTEDKKESAGEWGRIGAGIGGIVLAYVLWPWIGGAASLAALFGVSALVGGGSLLSGIVGIFTPDKTISPLVYIGGGLILILAVLKRKK